MSKLFCRYCGDQAEIEIQTPGVWLRVCLDCFNTFKYRSLKGTPINIHAQIGELKDNRKKEGKIKIMANKVKNRELVPGDLFSNIGPEYWKYGTVGSIGEKVYIRTNNPINDSQEEEVYRIEVKNES